MQNELQTQIQQALCKAIEHVPVHVGVDLELRDYFAGQALAGMLAAELRGASGEAIAFRVYQVADAMLKARAGELRINGVRVEVQRAPAQGTAVRVEPANERPHGEYGLDVERCKSTRPPALREGRYVRCVLRLGHEGGHLGPDQERW